MTRKPGKGARRPRRGTLVGPLVASFLKKWLPEFEDASEHTIRSYSTALTQLGEYMKVKHGIAPSVLTFEDLEGDTLIGFLDWLEEEKGLKTSSRNVRLGALKSFASYVQFKDPAQLDFCVTVSAIGFKKSDEIASIKFISREAVNAVIEEGAKAGLRDHALLQLLYTSGARESEFVNINTGDVRFYGKGKRATIQFYGKGRKTRVVTVDKKTTRLLEIYISKFEPDPDGPLFFNRYRKRLSCSGLKHIVGKYGRLARELRPDLISMDLTPHTLRHSIATHMLRAGVSLEFLSLFLGHSSIETTRIYAKVDPEAVATAVDLINEELIEETKTFEPEEEETLLSWLNDDYLKRHAR